MTSIIWDFIFIENINSDCLFRECVSIPTTTVPAPIKDLKMALCVLPEMSETMLRSLELHPEYTQLDIVTCQPHEECSPISHNINIGKFGLG